ncbi:hypothetical protein V8F20_009686 [Naviculisporaceae sp. PSN 640]
METVKCICKTCDSELGECINIWTKIGDRYVSPVTEPDSGLALQDEGDVRVGNKGSIVEECRLQNVACSSCAKELGLRCIDTPVNHVLGEVNSQGGGAYEIVDVFRLQSELQMQREELNRIDTNGFKVIHTLDKRMTGIEREVKKLQSTLGDVRRDMSGAEADIKSVKAEVGDVKRLVQSHPSATGLEERFDSLTSTLGDVRQQVTGLVGEFNTQMAELKLELGRSKQDMESLKSDMKMNVSSRQHVEDMSAVRAELAQLMREMSDIRSSKSRDQPSTPFPHRELEILTTNIAKIGSRANQVEPLQMEFEILKGRVERMEAGRQSLNSEPRPLAINTSIASDSHSQLKRSFLAIEEPAVPSPALTKRPLLSPAYLPTPTESHHTSPDREEDTVPNIPVPKVRLTKDGKVDKRSLRSRKPANGTK